MMRTHSILALCAAMSLCGCASYTGQGAMVGGTFGSMLGSAIGGISGGPRGSDIGTIVGMASGAAIGAAVGAQADEARQEKYRQYMEEREQQYGRSSSQRATQQQDGVYATSPAGSDDSGFDPTHSGDDRITFEPQDDDGYTTVSPRTVSVNQLAKAMPGYKVNRNDGIEVRNVCFIDANGDGKLKRGERCKVSFEIMNRSDVTIYDVQPTVVETTGNKHIHVSSPLYVESIRPGRGVKYTASIYADSRLKDGEAVIRVAVAQGDREITSQVSEFRVVTAKR